MTEILTLKTTGQGLYEFTERVATVVAQSTVDMGLCTLFVMHTSASLTIQENADPTAKQDLENWLKRLVPEQDPLFTHILEGADDMPSHIKSVLTDVSISIPIFNGNLTLGTWQGIYLWEHRVLPHTRRVAVSVLSADA